MKKTIDIPKPLCYYTKARVSVKGAIMPEISRKPMQICVDAGGGRSLKREISAEYVRF